MLPRLKPIILPTVNISVAAPPTARDSSVRAMVNCQTERSWLIGAQHSAPPARLINNSFTGEW